MNETDTSRSRASERIREEIEEHAESGDLRAVGSDFGYLGRAYAEVKEYERAVLAFENALVLHRSLQDGWGMFLDLQSQGEALLSIQKALPGALAAMAMATKIAQAIGAPEAEDAEARYQIILRQMEDRFPARADEIKSALEEGGEELRAEFVHGLLEDRLLAKAFFSDQLRVARLLEDSGGIVSCLGSLSHVLAEAKELEGASAALILARREAEDLPSEYRGPVDEMLDEWRAGLVEAAGVGKPISAFEEAVAADPEAALDRALRAG